MKKIEKNRLPSHHGFTLVEVLIVMVIIGILSAIAYPFFSGWYANIQVRTASRQVYSDLAWARNEAIRLNCDVDMILDTPNSYHIFADNGIGGGGAGDGVQNGTEPTIRTGTLPVGKGPFISAFLTVPALQSLGFSSRGIPPSRLTSFNDPTDPTPAPNTRVIVGSIQVASTKTADTLTTGIRVAGSIATTTP